MVQSPRNQPIPCSVFQLVFKIFGHVFFVAMSHHLGQSVPLSSFDDFCWPSYHHASGCYCLLIILIYTVYWIRDIKTKGVGCEGRQLAQ